MVAWRTAGTSSTAGFLENTPLFFTYPCSFQCSDKSCLRTPSLKKRVSDANLEGKKDSGMLKYIRLQVLAPGSEGFMELLTGRELQTAYLLMFGTYSVSWYSVGIKPLQLVSKSATKCARKKNLFLLDNQLPQARLGNFGLNHSYPHCPHCRRANFPRVCNSDTYGFWNETVWVHIPCLLLWLWDLGQVI